MRSITRSIARKFGSRAQTQFDLKHNVMEIGTQSIFVGTESLAPFVNQAEGYAKRPLIVTDGGIVGLGMLEPLIDALKKGGMQPCVFNQTQPNPGIPDVQGIARAFFEGQCDAIVGYGGGGPLDAAKGGAALIGAKRVNESFDIDADAGAFIENIWPYMSELPSDDPWFAAVPLIAAIPTTSGTGSEGGKSAVITDTKGVKRVFGNPVFMPQTVALVPQFTEKMPAGLTAATGIDALFHNMEAFFVTRQAAYDDGMNDAEIAETDDFGLRGIQMTIDNLPNAVRDGSDLMTRLNMQVAALYGAKAFRKAALGGVHATAHSIGAHYHLHHGSAIARMALPVMRYTQERASDETNAAYNTVSDMFIASGYNGGNCVESCGAFMQPFGIPVGLAELPVQSNDIDTLTQLSSNDPCQTNPVVLQSQDYEAIFKASL